MKLTFVFAFLGAILLTADARSAFKLKKLLQARRGQMGPNSEYGQYGNSEYANECYVQSGENAGDWAFNIDCENKLGSNGEYLLSQLPLFNKQQVAAANGDHDLKKLLQVRRGTNGRWYGTGSTSGTGSNSGTGGAMRDDDEEDGSLEGQLPLGGPCQTQIEAFVMGNLIQLATSEEGLPADLIEAASQFSPDITAFLSAAGLDEVEIPDSLDVDVCPDTLDLPELADVVSAVSDAVGDTELANLLRLNIARQIAAAATFIHAASEMDCDAERQMSKLYAMIRPGSGGPGGPGGRCPHPGMMCAFKDALENNPDGLRNMMCAQALLSVAVPLHVLSMEEMPVNPFANVVVE